MRVLFLLFVWARFLFLLSDVIEIWEIRVINIWKAAIKLNESYKSEKTGGVGIIDAYGVEVEPTKSHEDIKEFETRYGGW